MWTWPNLFHNRSCGCSQSTQVLRNRLRRFPNSMPTVRSSLSASTQTVGFAGAAPRSMVQHTLWHALDMLRLFYAFWHWGSQLVTFSCAKHSERSSSDRQHSSWKTLKGKGWKGHERSNDVSTIFATIQPGHQRVLYFNQFNYFAIAVYSGIARWHWKVAARFQDLAFSGIRLHSVAFGCIRLIFQGFWLHVQLLRVFGPRLLDRHGATCAMQNIQLKYAETKRSVSCHWTLGGYGGPTTMPTPMATALNGWWLQRENNCLLFTWRSTLLM